MGSRRRPWITRKGEIDPAEPARAATPAAAKPCCPAERLTRARRRARKASQRRQPQEPSRWVSGRCPGRGHAPSVARVRLAQGLAFPILGKKGVVGLAYLG